MVTRYEIVKVLAGQRVGNERVFHIGSVVVVPNILRRFALRKEEHVSLNPLRI